jgi:hypothetical protein
VIYLVVGVDCRTLAPWHRNIHAQDATAAARDAVDRARNGGVDLVVAAVIGPELSVVHAPTGARVAAA